MSEREERGVASPGEGGSAAALGADPGVIESVLEAGGVGAVAVSPVGTVEWIDDRTRRYFNCGDAAVGTDRNEFLDAVVGPTLADSSEFRASAWAEGDTGAEEVTCHVLPGEGREERWLRCRSRAIEAGPLTGGRLDQFVDVTDELTEERYGTAVENFPGGAVTLVDRDLRYRLARGELFEHLPEGPADVEGRAVEEVDSGNREAIAAVYRAALDGERASTEITLGEQDYLFRALPVTDEDGGVRAAVGLTQDITEQTERERELRKRERILRELHAATREFYPPGSMTEVSEFVVEFFENAFGFAYVSVKRFDEASGVLTPDARSAGGSVDTPGAISPGTHPLWEVYRGGETRLFESGELAAFDAPDGSVNQVLAVPIGDFGLAIAVTTGDRAFDKVDVDLAEVLATNAEAVFRSLANYRARTTLTERLSAQEAWLGELRGVLDALRAIQQRVADSESREAMETGICEELLAVDRVDFAYIARPEGADADLVPVAWSGESGGYLDSVHPEQDNPTPAQQAALNREIYTVPSISRHVLDEHWAKAAVSAGFGSAMSVPLVYDDVLYGVLTVYSRGDSEFEEPYEDLLRSVASLLVNYGRMLKQRRHGDGEGTLELAFDLSDSTYPLQLLATETASRIRYDTLVERTPEGDRVLATVVEGDHEAVYEWASGAATIRDVEWFGDPEDRQLSLTVQRPFLASEVEKHGGQLVHAVSGEGDTRIRIHLSRSVSKRPLLAALTTRYCDIDLVAQRQADGPDFPEAMAVTDLLTDRQYETLNAAYHGGYYETPRGVTGEELAASFDISSPATYNHLQAAHRALLGRVFGRGGGDRD
ncbi:MAG: bacterio-opsin activator domain-containing protein [Halobacteriales archaeon]